MPAIHPDRLKREAEELQGLIENPRNLLWRVVELLAFYADRTKRQGVKGKLADATTRYRVPSPVMQALRTSLTRLTQPNPRQAHEIAQLFWEVRVQEVRLLAVAVLGNAEESFDTIQMWARSTRDPIIVQSLANLAHQSLKTHAGDVLQDRVSRWLLSRSDSLQQLAFSILLAAAEDKSEDHIPIIFETLTSVGFRRQLISRPGYSALLEFLTKENPAETAGYLLVGLKRGRANLSPVIRDLLPFFPESQRDRLDGVISK
jgi:hypothetical protein